MLGLVDSIPFSLPSRDVLKRLPAFVRDWLGTVVSVSCFLVAADADLGNLAYGTTLKDAEGYSIRSRSIRRLDRQDAKVLVRAAVAVAQLERLGHEWLVTRAPNSNLV